MSIKCCSCVCYGVLLILIIDLSTAGYFSQVLTRNDFFKINYNEKAKFNLGIFKICQENNCTTYHETTHCMKAWMASGVLSFIIVIVHFIIIIIYLCNEKSRGLLIPIDFILVVGVCSFAALSVLVYIDFKNSIYSEETKIKYVAYDRREFYHTYVTPGILFFSMWAMCAFYIPVVKDVEIITMIILMKVQDI